MTLILIAFAIGAGFRCHARNSYRIDGIFDYVMEVIFPAIGLTILFAVLPLIVGIIAYNNAEWVERQTGVWNIASIERTSEISGHFVLGTGNINSHPVYYFYTGSNGDYRLGSANAYSTEIHERDSTQPKDYEYAKFTKNYILRFLQSDIPFVVKDEFSCSKDERDAIVIPVGSIKKEFHS